MALPPAAVESATIAQVPFLTGAFAAYSTISLLLACAKTANPEISHTAQALLRQAKIKFGFLKAATCMFPSPDAVSIQYRRGADDLRIVLKRRFCDTPRSRREGTQVLPPLEALIKLSLITAHQTKWRCRLVFCSSFTRS